MLKAKLKSLQPSYDRITKTNKRMPTKRVYICSPFSGDVERNVCSVREYCRFAFDEGYVPIAPHLYYPLFLDDGDKDERAAGLKYGLEELWRCKEVWVFGNISSGMKAEIELAKDLKIPIKYFYSDMTEAKG